MEAAVEGARQPSRAGERRRSGSPGATRHAQSGNAAIASNAAEIRKRARTCGELLAKHVDDAIHRMHLRQGNTERWRMRNVMRKERKGAEARRGQTRKAAWSRSNKMQRRQASQQRSNSAATTPAKKLLTSFGMRLAVSNSPSQSGSPAQLSAHRRRYERESPCTPTCNHGRSKKAKRP